MDKNLIQTWAEAIEVIGGHLGGEHDNVEVGHARDDLTGAIEFLTELRSDLKGIVSDLRERGAIYPGGTEQGLLLYWAQQLDPEGE